MPHTPGPWQIDPQAKNHVIAESRPICSISYFTTSLPDNGVADNKANARLIAAAPEMYKAVKAITAWFDSEKAGADYGVQNRDTHPDGERIWQEWWDRQSRLCDLTHNACHAALAKIEGK